MKIPALTLFFYTLPLIKFRTTIHLSGLIIVNYTPFLQDAFFESTDCKGFPLFKI